MRNIQQGYARWYNKTYARRGRFWADRFKSTLLYGEDALLECMQVVDLNPVRAGMVGRPEDYTFGAFALREGGEAGLLLGLRDLLSEKTEGEAFLAIKARFMLEEASKASLAMRLYQILWLRSSVYQNLTWVLGRKPVIIFVFSWIGL
jgi:hypothetical protein